MERYRIHSEAAVYFVTYSVVEWLPVFIDASACGVVAESLVFCRMHKQLRINAFVIMPTHLHLIVFHSEFRSDRLQQTLTEFRKYTGRTLSDRILHNGPKHFSRVLHEAAIAHRNRRFWQPSRHPVALETEVFWRQKLDYLHENPQRKGLVRRAMDWRYSSAAWYVSDGQEPCDVPISPLDWS